MMKKNNGLTMIEILVAMSIVAILSTFGLINYQTASAKARDGVRKNHLSQLSTALGIYFQKNNKYIPGSGNCDSDTPALYTGIASYMSNQAVPRDPVTNAAYCYISDQMGSSYRLFAKLEKCSDPSNSLCPYIQYNYSVVSDNLTIEPAPGDTTAASQSHLFSGTSIFSLFPTPTQPVWTENWDSMSSVQNRWDNIGSPCYSIPQPGILDMVCQSNGLASKQYWDKTKEIEVTGRVRAEPAPGSTTDAYWGGLTLYNNNGADNNYGELASQRNVPPFGGDHTAKVVTLTNDIGATITPESPWSWHDFKIKYSNGSYDYFVDGNLVKTVNNVPLTADPDIFVLCVSVGTGTPNDGSSSHCQFGPITVAGTQAQPPPPPSLKKVFVSKNWVSGSMGGLAGADSWCQNQANQASLGGSFKAWLSNSSTSASSRLSHASVPYKLVDDTTVVNNWNDLVDGTLSNKINKDQFGALADGIVTWTNTKPDGSIENTNSCNNWSSVSGSSNTGHSGFTDTQWTQFGSDNCGSYKALYCFEQ